MTQYIIRRVLQAFLVMFGVTFLVFIVMFQAGDPVILMASPDATQEDIDNLRRSLGLDRPWYIQYADFLGGAVQGDFGTSLRQGQPVFDLVLQRIPATLTLAIAAFVFSVAISIPVGIISATKRNSIWDNLTMGFALIGQSFPVHEHVELVVAQRLSHAPLEAVEIGALLDQALERDDLVTLVRNLRSIVTWWGFLVLADRFMTARPSPGRA
jgi:ABC-type dipeptide/oligopeptide/nickel transport system permease component